MLAAKTKRTLDPGRRVRVLIVDDSPVIRRLVTRALEVDPCIEVVGTAANGKEALDRIARLAPDVVTMDIEMPEMGGFEALRNIRQKEPDVRVVMLSTLTERGACASLEALALGADDYVTKVSTGESIEDSKAKLSKELIPKIKQFFIFQRINESTAVPNQSPKEPAPNFREPETLATLLDTLNRPRLITIGISTGGPTALASTLHQFPKNFSLPILIVQHMPPVFTKLLCERLQERVEIPVREAVHNETVKPGVILIAPGDFHMRVELRSGERDPRISLDQAPHENSCRPSVDVLFESLAQVYGGGVIAAVMTGMGHDGLRGARLLKKSGATVLAQDQETSAVWGMPRAIVEAKIADAVLPLTDIVPHILRQCTRFSALRRALQESSSCRR